MLRKAVTRSARVHITIEASFHRARSRKSNNSSFLTTSSAQIHRAPFPLSQASSPPASQIRAFTSSNPAGSSSSSSSSSSSPPPNAATTTTTATTPASISTDEYHDLADAYIEGLLAELEEVAEGREDVDVEYSAGVLRLDFPPAGTYVVNKQPPNRQIWLSSPISGPKRYDWVVVDGSGGEGTWVYLRDGSTLNQLLETELGIDTSRFGEELD